MDAQHGTCFVPGCNRAVFFRIDRDQQALVTAPTRADAEQFQPIDQGDQRLSGTRLQHDPEKAGRTQEIALP